MAFTLHGCLTHVTLPDFYDSYLCFKEELGSKHSWFMPIADGGWDYNDVKIYEEQLRKIKDDIIADCEKIVYCAIIAINHSDLSLILKNIIPATIIAIKHNLIADFVLKYD